MLKTLHSCFTLVWRIWCVPTVVFWSVMLLGFVHVHAFSPESLEKLKGSIGEEKTLRASAAEADNEHDEHDALAVQDEPAHHREDEDVADAAIAGAAIKMNSPSQSVVAKPTPAEEEQVTLVEQEQQDNTRFDTKHDDVSVVEQKNTAAADATDAASTGRQSDTPLDVLSEVLSDALPKDKDEGSAEPDQVGDQVKHEETTVTEKVSGRAVDHVADVDSKPEYKSNLLQSMIRNRAGGRDVARQSAPSKTKQAEDRTLEDRDLRDKGLLQAITARVRNQAGTSE